MDWIYCESGEAHANQRQRGVAEDPDLSNEAPWWLRPSGWWGAADGRSLTHTHTHTHLVLTGAVQELPIVVFTFISKKRQTELV
jgi:hypothetical protein